MNINLPHDHNTNIKSVLAKIPDNEKFINAAEIFKTLGDPTRLKILWILCHSRECVSDIAAAVGMSKAVISHHLQLLKRSNLVKTQRIGQEIHYSLNDSLPEANLLHKSIEAIFNISCPAIDENF
ncbi:MAG: winged helix-turn-helix transcriptional regulator [Synergistaceae bacterium]|nr:winged helix-turn-helix transcriptional regulator [Synergistaceae bacterium]